jgi:hypothetical protein
MAKKSKISAVNVVLARKDGTDKIISVQRLVDAYQALGDIIDEIDNMPEDEENPDKPKFKTFERVCKIVDKYNA